MEGFKKNIGVIDDIRIIIEAMQTTSPATTAKRTKLMCRKEAEIARLVAMETSVDLTI